MNAFTSGDPSSRLLCPQPHCHTLNLEDATVCFRCGFALEWTKRFPRFREALRVWADLRPETDPRVESKTRVEIRTENSRFVTTLRDGKIQCRLENGALAIVRQQSLPSRLTVELDEKSINLPVPGRQSECGATFRAWQRLRVAHRQSPPALCENPTDPRPLVDSQEWVIGRDCRHELPLDDARMDLTHCVIVCRWVEGSTIGRQKSATTGNVRGLPEFWIADCHSSTGTYVNRRRILASRIRAGDLLQIGNFAWTFSPESRRLVPASPIAGVGLRLRNYRVRPVGCADREATRERVFNLSIPAGEFWILSGESGTGKSTLLNGLIQKPNVRMDGEILIDEPIGTWSAIRDSERYRELLGYVSQNSYVHRKLTPLEALRFAAQCRGLDPTDVDLRRELRRCDLTEEQQHRLVGDLSGGEEKRVRTAAMMIGSPRLLLLDEPDSGLDNRRRRDLMRRLRTLSWQGCTVLLVSHGPAWIRKYCDRTLVLKADGGHEIEPAPAEETAMRSFAEAPHSLLPPLRNSTRTGWHQFWLLLLRECTVARNDTWTFSLRRRDRMSSRSADAPAQSNRARYTFPSRLVPLIGVPLLFGLAVGFCTDRDNPQLLGFLAILSSVWMGAGTSLLAICGEREVYDHERALFLRIPAYVGAKVFWNGLLVAVQMIVFLTILVLARWQVGDLDNSPVSTAHWPATGAVLLAVGEIGVALGLLLSAAANNHQTLASSLLPLVLMIQIVASVFVADNGHSRDGLGRLYDSRFSLGGSAERRAIHRTAVVASYGTITRYADIALRAATSNYQMTGDAKTKSDGSHPRQLITATLALAGWFVGLILAVMGTLQLQSHGRKAWFLRLNVFMPYRLPVRGQMEEANPKP